VECERVWQHSLIDGVQLTLAPCLDDFRIRCAPVLIEQLVSLSRVVSSRRTGRPQVFGRVPRQKSQQCSHLTSESRKAQGRSCRRSPVVSLYANKSGVCVCRRRRWSIILPEVYHVLKLTRRSAKSDLGVSATCAKPALTSPRAEESRVANLSHGTRSSSALPYGRL